MEIIILAIIIACVTLEILTLVYAFNTALGSKKGAIQIIKTNIKLVFMYSILALLLFPITLISTVIPNCRGTWELLLINSIKNNKDISWFFIC